MIKSIFIGCLLASAPAFAGFRMSPIVVHFSGKQLTQVLAFENQGETKTPVQIEAFTRTMNEKGEEVREKTSDFVIYPEQLVLMPKEKRNVRVTYSGDVPENAEKAFRLVASQLPVEFANPKEAKTAKVNLNFLIQYVASAYVTPLSARPQVKVIDATWVAPKKVELTLQNEGGAHLVLVPKKLRLKHGDNLVAEMDAPAELQSFNLLAKTKVKIPVAFPMDIKKQELRAELELSDSAE